MTFDIHDIDKFLHRVRQVDLYIYIYEGEDFTVQIHSGNVGSSYLGFVIMCPTLSLEVKIGKVKWYVGKYIL